MGSTSLVLCAQASTLLSILCRDYPSSRPHIQRAIVTTVTHSECTHQGMCQLLCLCICPWCVRFADVNTSHASTCMHTKLSSACYQLGLLIMQSTALMADGSVNMHASICVHMRLVLGQYITCVVRTSKHPSEHSMQRLPIQ